MPLEALRERIISTCHERRDGLATRDPLPSRPSPSHARAELGLPRFSDSEDSMREALDRRGSNCCSRCGRAASRPWPRARRREPGAPLARLPRAPKRSKARGRAGGEVDVGGDDDDDNKRVDLEAPGAAAAQRGDPSGEEGVSVTAASRRTSACVRRRWRTCGRWTSQQG